MLKPNFKMVGFSTIFHAIFHAVITVSIATGAYFTFSSYSVDSLAEKKRNKNKGSKGDSLVKYALINSVLIMLMMVIYGVTVLPVMYSTNIFVKSGLSNLLNLIPDFFYNIRFGSFTGFMLFVFIMFLTILSAISLFEVIISFIVNRLKWKRSIVVTFTGLLCFGFIYLGFLLISGKPAWLPFNITKSIQSITVVVLIIARYVITISTLLITVFIALTLRKQS